MLVMRKDALACWIVCGSIDALPNLMAWRRTLGIGHGCSACGLYKLFKLGRRVQVEPSEQNRAMLVQTRVNNLTIRFQPRCCTHITYGRLNDQRKSLPWR